MLGQSREHKVETAVLIQRNGVDFTDGLGRIIPADRSTPFTNNLSFDQIVCDVNKFPENDHNCTRSYSTSIDVSFLERSAEILPILRIFKDICPVRRVFTDH